MPDSAAVDLAVTHAKSDPRTARFAALVNAVLRGLARDKDDGAAARPRHARPMRRTGSASACARRMAPSGREAILAAHRIESPTDFTVKADPQRWAEAFGGIVLPTGSVRVGALAGPVPELPGFDDGEWWVQDAAAALPARLLGDVSGPARRRSLRRARRQDGAARSSPAQR